MENRKLCGVDMKVDVSRNGAESVVMDDSKILVELSKEEDKDNHSLVGNFIVEIQVAEECDYALGKDNICSWWLDQTNDPTDTSVKACWLSGSIQYGDDKLYQQRKRMEDLEKETKGFTHVVSQCYMWKWLTRKKIGGTQCKVELKKWKFNIWRWPERKKERRKESYVQLMFCWSEICVQRIRLDDVQKEGAVMLLFMFDAVVDGSSKIRRRNELKTKFAREGIKYEVGDWVDLTLQPYVQVSVRQSHLPKVLHDLF
ncbi:hypothetical protein Tco_1164804 [Tanacetum coccineum]